MDKKQLEDYVKVATGKARVKLAAKELTPAQRFAKKLVEANRKSRAGISEEQLKASVLRG